MSYIFPLLYTLKNSDTNQIANNYTLSSHAKQRIKERFSYSKYKSVKKAIAGSKLSYVNNDGTITVGLDDGSAFKFAQPAIKNRVFHIITYHEPSANKKSLKKKLELTRKGYRR